MADKEKKELSDEQVAAKELTEEKIVDLKTDEAEIEEPLKELTPLESALIEAEEYKKLSIRLQADFENYKKRNKELSGRMYSLGIEETVMTVFPVIDSLEIALNLFDNEKERQGLELIIKQFLTAFEKLGIKEIEALDKDFNPELHDAVLKCDSEGKSGKVVEVLRKGYILGDKVIRPSMVKVAN